MRFTPKYVPLSLAVLLFILAGLAFVALSHVCSWHTSAAASESFLLWTACPCSQAVVPKTGQTMSQVPGDDGDLERGMAWPDPRFTDNSNGTVTDLLTGLIWLKNTNCPTFFSGDSTGQNSRTCYDAVTAANALGDGYCGLTDGSVAGDWRLPQVRELQSLIDYGQDYPALPSGHPFTGVQYDRYWSSTMVASGPVYAWRVDLRYGGVDDYYNSEPYYVWPVRGGQ